MNWLVEIWWSTVLLVLLLLVRGSSCNMELLNWFNILTDLGNEQIGDTTVFWLKEVVPGHLPGLPSRNAREAMEVARLLEAAVKGSSDMVWKTVTKEGLTFDIGLISLKTLPEFPMFIMKPNHHSCSTSINNGKSYCHLLMEAIMMPSNTLLTPFRYATYNSHFLSYLIYTGNPNLLHVYDKLKSLFTTNTEKSVVDDDEFVKKFNNMMGGS